MSTENDIIQEYIAHQLQLQYPEIDHADMVKRLAKAGAAILAQLTPEKCHLWHMASCAPSEASELFDAVKKWVIYGKGDGPDLANVIEELGDLEFYMEGVRNCLGITRERTLIANMEKLEKGVHARYKDGYTDAAAAERADKIEVGERELPKAGKSPEWNGAERRDTPDRPNGEE